MKGGMMKHKKIVNVFVFGLILFAFIGSQLCFSQSDGDDITIGKYRVIHSKILNEDRTLLIHLPRGYKNDKQYFPVVYMLYGNHITTYFAEAVSILDNLGPTGRIPECILVGIMNTNRYRDLLPKTPDGKPTGIANFTRFLKEEVFTFINGKYRTKNYRILVGPQAGANFALYTLFEHPALFNACIINHPFRWRGGREVIMQKAKGFLKDNSVFNKFVFITYDGSDSLAREGIAYIKRFAKMAEENNPRGFSLALNFIEIEDEFLQRLGLREGIKKLFERYPVPEKRKMQNLNDILAYYGELSKKYGFEVDTPEHVLTVQGDGLMQRGKIEKVIKVLKYTMKQYPKAANSYFRMSNILMRRGNLEGARDYLRKAVELIPHDSGMFGSRLARLEKMIVGSAAYQVEKVIRSSGFDAGVKLFKKLKSTPKSSFYFDEREFNQLGYRIMQTGNLAEAIKLFQLNVELYPHSANVYDSLAEAFMKSGDKMKAIKNYKKSLKLNPKSNNAKEMLKKLEKNHPTL